MPAGPTLAAPRRKTYHLFSLEEDGFGVRVVGADGGAAVTEFRTVEEAAAWIDLQKRKDEDGELTL